MKLFEECQREACLRRLTDPGCPTHKGGGPRAYTPEDWFHTQGEHKEDCGDRAGDALHPAAVLLNMAISDHYPLPLALTREEVPKGRAGPRFPLYTLTPDK